MVHSKNPKNTEVDAYSYIKTELEKLGWVVKNPARIPEGEVYKQNEGLYNVDIKECLIQDMPEAIIKLNEVDLWVIESKRDKKEINKALDEAKNQYAKKLNQSNKIKCVIISGIAGNDTDGYTIINQYLHDEKWETILFNGKAKDTLLSKEQTNYLLNNKTPNWQEFPDFPEEKYLSSAKIINEILHNAGVNKNKRARFIAGLILSLSLNEDIDLRTEKTKLLVSNINNLIKSKLEDVEKDNFYDFIKLEVPPSKENHIKYKQAIIDTLKELQTLDIKNAMASGRDILGNLYEKFLKYGNWAKEIGIVLTPRHITKFGVEVLDVKNNDYILDPACGTGGFLVSAFDYVKNNSNKKQLQKFKDYNMFGIDQDDEIITLALVNMIFRGDGKNNMGEGNCFQKNILKIQKKGYETGKYDKREGNENKYPLITKVLMNPPFALKKGDEKEYKFIDYALSQMEDGGLLFAILPSPIMFKSQKVKNWRKEMLKNNTLRAVIKFPEDLFYPVGVHTSGVIIQKGVPHNFDNDVFWSMINDGYVKKKGVMRKKGEGNIEFVKSAIKDFLNNSSSLKKSVPKVYSIEPILNDKDLECAPEYYLKEEKHTNKEIIGGMTKSHLELIDFLLKNPFFKGAKINVDCDVKINPDEDLENLFIIENAKSQNIEDYGDGKMPFVTSTTTNNGVEKYIDEDDDNLIYKKPCITLSSFGQANVQITPFVARSHGAVLVLVPEYLLFSIKSPKDFDSWNGKLKDDSSKHKIEIPQEKKEELKSGKKVFVDKYRVEKGKDKLNIYISREMSIKQLLCYASQINLHKWRFSYGRWVTKKRLLKLEIQNINQIKLPSIDEIKKPIEESLKFIKNSGI